MRPAAPPSCSSVSVRRNKQGSASVRRPVRFRCIRSCPIAGCISLFVYWLVESSTYSFVVPTCVVVYTHSLFVGPCPCAIIGSLRNRFPVSVGSLSFPSFACSSVQDPRGPASFHHALANNPDTESVLGFFSRPEIEFFIRILSDFFFYPFPSPPPPQVRHVEMLRPKRIREVPHLVQAKGFGEDIGSLPIRQNIYEFDFTEKDTLADKVVVYLNVLGPGMQDRVPRKLDGTEVVIVDPRRIRHLHLQILE